jgi:hypothetical protein
MLHYATYHPTITSEIVILSNADQVFDETLSHALPLSNNTIFVLATQGYSADSVPPRIHAQYRALIEHEALHVYDTGTDNWCEPQFDSGDEMEHYSFSWDTYIFHRSLLMETVPVNKTDHGKFTRLNFRREPSMYYMNEGGAEYAALYDIVRGLLGKVTVWNACHLIQTWHFHLTAKMHHSTHTNARWPNMPFVFGGGYLFYEDYGPVMPRDGESMESNDTIPNLPSLLVPTPSFFAPFCTNITSCHSENPLSATDYLNWPQQDASAMLSERSSRFL